MFSKKRKENISYYCLICGHEIESKENHVRELGHTIFGKDGKDIITEEQMEKILKNEL